ncbi:MAG: hypothetical protein ACHQ49_18120 [Elusimicrobiota bacterium]
MRNNFRRAARLGLLAVVGFGLPAAAVEVAVPHIGIDAALSAAPAAFVGASLPGLSASFSAASLSAPALLPPSAALSAAAPAFSAPALAAPAAAPALAASPAAFPAASDAPRSVGTPALDALRSEEASRGGSGARFDGQRAHAPSDAALTVNDEGVYIMGRAAAFYREIKRMAAVLAQHLDLRETLDVIDGTIADVRTKLLTIEAVAKDRKVADANTHLEETLTWVDATLQDGDRKIAVHTYQVYFHPAPAGPLKATSEIDEGNRRVDAYLAQAAKYFVEGGDAEKAIGKLDEIDLAFDTRGYPAIKDHIRAKEAEFKATVGDRVRFVFVDEVTPPAETTAQIRADYNRLVEKYKNDRKGLQKILEGVMYSRYVGVLLELKTLEYYTNRHYKVLQSGRDFFGPDGKYITEFDAVVKSPRGDVLLVEAKSARVGLPIEEVMRDKVFYKLDIYKKNQGLIEKMIGAPLKVVFSFDVGGRDIGAAMEGELAWKDLRQKELMEYLKTQEPVLTEKYGFPVSFLFLNSHPGEDPMLFYKTPIASPKSAGSGRKHGRNGRRHSGN